MQLVAAGEDGLPLVRPKRVSDHGVVLGNVPHLAGSRITAAAVPQAVAEGSRRGIRAAIIISGDSAEPGAVSSKARLVLESQETARSREMLGGREDRKLTKLATSPKFRIFRDRRWGGRRLGRPAMALMWRFMVGPYLLPARPGRGPRAGVQP